MFQLGKNPEVVQAARPSLRAAVQAEAILLGVGFSTARLFWVCLPVGSKIDWRSDTTIHELKKLWAPLAGEGPGGVFTCFMTKAGTNGGRPLVLDICRKCLECCLQLFWFFDLRLLPCPAHSCGGH